MNFTYYNSPIGPLKITASDNQIIGVDFCDESIVATTIKTDSPILQQCITELTEYFAGTRQVFTVPHSQSGTPFQCQVWQALEAIPYGHTWSYSQQAKHIENITAIRAVGQTNGKNKLAIIVPCHRVIGKNGSLVGYAGSLKRKEWLLEHERKNSRS